MSQQKAERVERPVVEGLEKILGKAFPILDDGFIRLVDYMGDDGSIVQAARVSYGKGTRSVRDDRHLIRYLMRHRHSTPFEMCELKLHVRVPMDCWRQWIRHRTANVNEYSTRYSIAIDAAQTTPNNEWRVQAENRKQGSSGTLSPKEGQHFSDREEQLQSLAREVYDERLAAGIAREQARKDLPLGTYTEAYWKVDLHNLLHFLALRMDSHAQEEIRAYAATIGHEIVAKWVPHAWEAFLDYRWEGLGLTRLDIAVLDSLNSEGAEAACKIAQEEGMLNRNDDGKLKRSRERIELEAKMARLGITPPWGES